MSAKLVVILLVLALSGCANLATDPVGAPGTVSSDRFGPAVAVSKDGPGAEPVIAVLPDGTLFVEGIGSDGTQNVNKVYRSADQGKTWTDVTPTAEGTLRSNDGFVAAGNGGSVYAANVFSLTLQMFRSDDKGGTWTPLETPRIPALLHRHWILPVGAQTVHVAVEALPPWYLPYLAGQRPPQGIPATPNEGMWYYRSDDKGQTWSVPLQIDPNVNFAGQGNMVVSADGKFLAVLRYEEKQSPRDAPTYLAGHWYLVTSEDAGATWKRKDAFDLTSELAAALPTTAIDANGTLYAVWSQERNGTSSLMIAFTKDHGASWSAPRELGIREGAQAMPWIAAKAPGALGVIWYQADMPGRASKINATWDGMYVDITGADSVAPSAGLPLVVAPALHHGNICAKGPACVGGEDRRLLDYPWIAMGPQGAANVVFASTNWTRPSAFATVAVERVS